MEVEVAVLLLDQITMMVVLDQMAVIVLKDLKERMENSPHGCKMMLNSLHGCKMVLNSLHGCKKVLISLHGWLIKLREIKDLLLQMVVARHALNVQVVKTVQVVMTVVADVLEILPADNFLTEISKVT